MPYILLTMETEFSEENSPYIKTKQCCLAAICAMQRYQYPTHKDVNDLEFGIATAAW